jgi:hypothetical protein
MNEENEWNEPEWVWLADGVNIKNYGEIERFDWEKTDISLFSYIVVYAVSDDEQEIALLQLVDPPQEIDMNAVVDLVRLRYGL